MSIFTPAPGHAKTDDVAFHLFLEPASTRLQPVDAHRARAAPGRFVRDLLAGASV